VFGCSLAILLRITFCHQPATVCKLDSHAKHASQARQVVSDTEAEIMLRSIASSLRTLDRKMSSALYRAMPSPLAARVADIVMTLCVRCCNRKQIRRRMSCSLSSRLS
jgi:ABC-type sulfate transport system substrate-binding protein